MIEIQLPEITIFLVTLAALIYCVKFFAEIVFRLATDITRQYITHRTARYSAMLDDLHDAVSKEVDVHFDFWWSSEPSRIVREALKVRAAIPDEAREGLPEGMLDMFRDQFIDRVANKYRAAARHLAVHAVMGAKKKELLNTLPSLYGIRAVAISSQAEHEERLEDEREMLNDVGIDVNQLETEFSSNNR